MARSKFIDTLCSVTIRADFLASHIFSSFLPSIPRHSLQPHQLTLAPCRTCVPSRSASDEPLTEETAVAVRAADLRPPGRSTRAGAGSIKLTYAPADRRLRRPVPQHQRTHSSWLSDVRCCSRGDAPDRSKRSTAGRRTSTTTSASTLAAKSSPRASNSSGPSTRCALVRRPPIPSSHVFTDENRRDRLVDRALGRGEGGGQVPGAAGVDFGVGQAFGSGENGAVGMEQWDVRMAAMA